MSLLLGLSITASGCRSQQEPGSASFIASIANALSAADVTRVQVIISASDLSVPLSTDLVKTNGQWRGLIGGIPAGVNRTFTAKAYGADGTQLFEGQATGVTITAGQTTVVSLTLNPLYTGPLPGNVAPIIDSLIASATSVLPGGTLSLNATAHDPNPGDLLTYAWTATAGSFGIPAGNSITWTAPSFTGLVTLRLTVTDQSGAAVSMDLTLSVQSGTGSAEVIIRLNTWPHISGLSASPSPVAVGATTTLQSVAGDSEGDPLSYQWSASGCTGSWQGTTTAQASFTPDALPAGGACSCVISLTVSDGNGGQTTRSLALCVQLTTSTPQPPVMTSAFQSATTVPGGASVQLRVEGYDPLGGSLDFTWTANVGTLGAPTNGPGQSQLTWTAPDCVPLNTTPAIQVTLTTAQGLTTSYTFTVNGVLACGPNGPRSSPWTSLGGLVFPHPAPVAVRLDSNKVLIVEGQTAELYDPASDTSTPTRSTHQADLWGSTLTLLPGGKVLCTGSATPELYDPATETWSLTAPSSKGTGGHTATLLLTNKVLVAGGYGSATAELYDPATGAWTSTGSMATPRYGHTATRLNDGKVLVTGGANSTYLATSEIYDPATGTWSPTGSLITPRANHRAVLLPSKKVLVTGGTYNGTELATAEIYDPLTGAWASAGSMSSPRTEHAAVLLPSSEKVLVVGGSNSNAELNTAEIYDPGTGLWTPAASMKGRRSHLSATLLGSKVLVAGGEGGLGNTSQSAAATVEVYNPDTDGWASTSFVDGMVYQTNETALLPSGKVFVPLYGNTGAATFDPVTKQWTIIPSPGYWYDTTVTELPSHDFLVVGGDQQAIFSPSTSTWHSWSSDYISGHTATAFSGGVMLIPWYNQGPEVYDPLGGTWTPTGPMVVARYNHSATQLLSGPVLVAGGYGDTGPSAAAEIYDTATNGWTITGAMVTPHGDHMAVRLVSGKVLIAGGNSANTVELYDPDTASWSLLPSLPTSFSPSTGLLLSSGKVLALSYAEARIFDPDAPDTWAPAGAFDFGNLPHAHLLESNEVLVIRQAVNTWLAPVLYTP